MEVLKDTVRISEDPFHLVVTEEYGNYTAKILFNDEPIITNNGDDLKNVSRETVEQLYDSYTTDIITIHGNEYPVDVYEFDKMYYAHLRAEEDGFGFGRDRRRAIDRAIEEYNEKFGVRTLDDLDISVENIQTREKLKNLRERMENGEDIDWRFVEFDDDVMGYVDEAKSYYKLQDDEAIRWIDDALDSVRQ